ncbi:MAG: carbohydrate kinase, partial [Candidatus Gallimonas sp.]
MILSIGEILADMICERRNGAVLYRRCAGGAPFNVACAVKKCGGKVGFYGKVGDDSIGRALAEYAREKDLDELNVVVDPDSNTTLAFVDLDESGERSFTFYRKHTADYRLSMSEVRESIGRADVVHLGSLMLSEEVGRAFADEVVAETKRLGKKLSFDVNFREDVFRDRETAVKIYEKYVRAADVLKLSENEIGLFTSAKETRKAMKELCAPNKLVVLTLGKEGAAYACDGKYEAVPTIGVKPIDTTGAGDA